MPIPKLERYRQLHVFPNVFQPTPGELLQAPFRLAGRWNPGFFGRNGDLVLEMGCGWGDFALGLAKHIPQGNFLGLDLKGARIWRGAKAALEAGMKNLGFVRAGGEFADRLFGPGELQEIWLTFPTPFLWKPETMLVSPTFLARYRTILAAGGTLHLKTDLASLETYARRVWPHCGFRIIGDGEDPGNGADRRSRGDRGNGEGDAGNAGPATDSPLLHAGICTTFEARAIAEGRKIRHLRAVPLAGPVAPLPREIAESPFG